MKHFTSLRCEGVWESEGAAPGVLNPLNAELNPIFHLLALVGAHHILYVSRIRVNFDTSGRRVISCTAIQFTSREITLNTHYVVSLSSPETVSLFERK